MQYRNGQPVKAGDVIAAATYTGTPFIGVVLRVDESARLCNLQVLPVDPANVVTISAEDCLPVQEIFKPK